MHNVEQHRRNMATDIYTCNSCLMVLRDMYHARAVCTSENKVTNKVRILWCFSGLAYSMETNEISISFSTPWCAIID